MLEKKINRIKLYFVLLGILMVVGMFGAIVGLNKTPYLSGSYLKSKADYVKYWIEYQGGTKSLATAVTSVFARSPQTYVSDGRHTPDVPVLVYHGLLEKEDNSGGLNTTIENFKKQMFAMKRAGYNTVTMDDLLRYMKGEIALPPKSFVLTFDDGRKDSFYEADPILKALGYKAAMFVINDDSIDQKSSYYLTKDELAYMRETGRWELQAHTDDGHGFIPIDATGTKGNFFSNKMWLSAENRLETDEEFAARVSRDIVAAKERLESEFGQSIIAFTFPFGDFGQFDTNHPGARETLLRIVSENYPLFFYQTMPGSQYMSNYYDKGKDGSRTFLIRRIDYNRHWTKRGDFVQVIGHITSKELPYDDDFSRNRGWNPAWGEVRIGNGALTVTSRTAQSGGAAILDGSGNWLDYEVKATMSSPGRNGAYLWIRFKDEYNNAACNFGNGFAHIEQTVGGQGRVIKGIRNPNITIPEGDFTMTARVQGRRVECVLNGEVMVVTEFLDRSLTQGGIGFKTWAGATQSSLVVKKLSVKELDGAAVASNASASAVAR